MGEKGKNQGKLKELNQETKKRRNIEFKTRKTGLLEREAMERFKCASTVGMKDVRKHPMVVASR